MSKKDIAFRKEFEEFAKELGNSKPMLNDEDLDFIDFDNLINDFNIDNNNSKSGFNHYSSDFKYEDIIEDYDDGDLNNQYPKINIETDDISMSLVLKKDYSKINNLDDRKKEFIKDLKNFIDEFNSTEESNELMEYYE